MSPKGRSSLVTLFISVLSLVTVLSIAYYLHCAREVSPEIFFYLPPAPLGPEPPGEPPIAPPKSITTYSQVAEPETANCDSTVGDWCLYVPVMYNYDLGERIFARDLYRKEFLQASTPIEWTGSIEICEAGVTSQAFKDSILRRMNYFRRMAGVPLLEGFKDEYNTIDQAAALIMAANENLSHHPDADWKCFTETGYTGASTSNLVLGTNGPNAINAYIHDFGGNNTAVGHRRWILYPNTLFTGTGDIPYNEAINYSTNALRAWDENIWAERPPTRHPYVAWPPPGFVPYQVVYQRWSFSYPDADFGSALVTVEQNGEPATVIQYDPHDGYGDNTLVWYLDGKSGWHDCEERYCFDTYDVSVRNVLIDGNPQDFSYSVMIFDPMD